MLLYRLIFILLFISQSTIVFGQDEEIASQKVVSRFYDHLIALADEYGSPNDQLEFINTYHEYLENDAVLVNDLIPFGSEVFKGQSYLYSLMVYFNQGLELKSTIIGSRQDESDKNQWHVCIRRYLKGLLNTGDTLENTQYLVYTVNVSFNLISHSKKINQFTSITFSSSKNEDNLDANSISPNLTEVKIVEELMDSGRKEEIQRYIENNPSSIHKIKLKQRIEDLTRLEIYAKLPIVIMPLITDMVLVEGGKFTFGCDSLSENCSYDEKPQIEIEVESFYISPYEITQNQWIVIMSNNPSNNSSCEECPVENVSFEDVQLFIKKLNDLSLQSFRLPNEIEWEYSAIKGETKINYQNIWYNETCDSTQDVGSRAPNKIGIYDMLGNVWEWCNNSHFDYRYYEEWKDGSLKSDQKVIRGASFLNSSRYLRITNRLSFDKSKRDKTIGFRIIKDAK